MRRVLLGIALLGLAVTPLAARAGPLLEVSAGVGSQLRPELVRAPTNLMVAPGWGFAGVLRLELGMVAALGDVRNAKADMELRPMLVVAPPLFPLYARAIFAVQSLFNGPTQLAYGGALGVRFGIPLTGFGLFAELGVLPRNAKVDAATGAPVFASTSLATREEFRWFVEGRAGASYEF